MKSSICRLLGIEFPLIAFTHCRDVVVEVSKAGGMGVLGAVALSPEELEIELNWIDRHIQGKPYGVDILVPGKLADPGAGERQSDELFPAEHRNFVAELLAAHGIEGGTPPSDKLSEQVRKNIQPEGASRLLDVAFSHPIRLIASALGVAPGYLIERAKHDGIPVAALVGARDHAIRQVEAGVDVLVAAGTEAGGHCGEVSTLVLVPEILRAVREFSDIPVLAAGGIVTGRQMAACMAMGADGAWTGSVWLTTVESEISPVLKEKMLSADSRQTLRSKSRSGKYSRQLRSAWTAAWERPDSPAPLPMPLQSALTEPALSRVIKLAETGHQGALELASYFVGQGVGLMDQSLSVRTVVYDFINDFLEARERLNGLVDD